jgi:hypothetical protein
MIKNTAVFAPQFNKQHKQEHERLYVTHASHLMQGMRRQGERPPAAAVVTWLQACANMCMQRYICKHVYKSRRYIHDYTQSHTPASSTCASYHTVPYKRLLNRVRVTSGSHKLQPLGRIDHTSHLLGHVVSHLMGLTSHLVSHTSHLPEEGDAMSKPAGTPRHMVPWGRHEGE